MSQKQEVTAEGSYGSSPLARASLSELLGVRKSLHETLERSRSLGNALQRTGPRLQRLSMRMPSLQDAVSPLRSHKRVKCNLGTHIDKAVGPAIAVLKVFDAVHGLEKSLLSFHQPELTVYVSLVSRLEEAMAFLTENCNLAIQWLQEMVHFLEENNVLEEDQMSNLLSDMASLKAMEQAKLDGGLLDAALDRLETEFRRLLKDALKFIPLSVSTLLQQSSDAGKISPLLATQDVEKLQIIVERLAANSRAHICKDIYVEIRSNVMKDSMQTVELEYLELCYAELGSRLQWKPFEKYIEPWTQHIELVVRFLFDPEYHLCYQIFEKLESDERVDCFVRLVKQGKIVEFLQFGEVASRTHNEPQKLFKLLDMFQAMNNLRPIFSKLFVDVGCKEIQQRTRDLLKHLVQGAYENFLEFKQHVELQKEAEPPSDGSIPKLSQFVVGYVRYLVGDFYGPTMAQVLAIEQSWRNGGKVDDALLPKAIRSIMQALASSVRERAKFYKDQVLFHLFLMNNYWYLYVSCKTTELKLHIGDPWLRDMQQQAEDHASLYLKDGWGRPAQVLNIEAVLILTGSRAAARDLLKVRLKSFSSLYDELYARHSKWQIPDAELREKTYLKVVKAVVPAYRTYIQTYGPLMEQDGSPNKYARYTPQMLERMLVNLFQGSPEKIANGNERPINASTAVTMPTVVKVV